MSVRRSYPFSYWAMWVFLALLIAFLVVFGFTDTWPYMHEVIWQHSWHPVCPLPNGGLEFCAP
jgi:hypothetical protein